MEVVRRPLGVAGVAHEADHLSRLDVRAVHGVDRERGEVRVVELVAGLVDDPEPVAADLVEADGEDDAVGAGDERLTERAEDVVAVVVRDVCALRAERVDVGRRAVDREHVAAGRELRLHLERLRLRLPAALWTQVRGIADRRAFAGTGGRVVVVVVVVVVAGGAVWTAAVAVPIWISLPAGSPPWSAVSFKSSSVTAVLYPFDPAGAARVDARARRWSTDPSLRPRPCCLSPAGPATRRLTTVVPFALPPAPDGPVPADARAVTASAVISPLKSDTCVASASAFADAFFTTALVAARSRRRGVHDRPVGGERRTTTSSRVLRPGVTRMSPSPSPAGSGLRSGSHTRSRSRPASCVLSPALVETNARSASRIGRARRRRTALDDASGCR